MHTGRLLAHLRADIEAMTAAAAGVAPDRRTAATVDACPGWSVDDLLSHCAGVYRFATAQLHAPPGSDLVSFDPPEEADALDQLRAAGDALLSALEATDPDEHRPNWNGDETSRFYWRRMAQETAIHRADLEVALDGAATPIDTELAVDGIDELAEVFLPHAKARGITGDGETVHLHATDPAVADGSVAGGEWMFSFTPAGVTVTAEHGKGDMAVRGPASDLLLFAWNRRPITVECFGEPDALAWWPARVRI